MGHAGPDGLHPQLQADCLVIGRFPLCRLLLMRDAHYPWFILVPDRPEVTEIYQLDRADQCQLIQESSWLAAALAAVFQADKLNIAALGNVVPQLHVHHVVRYRTDAAWPAPVWGRLPAKAYTEEGLATVIARLKQGRLPDFEFTHS
ncbi:MAG: HIT domain-containing protein [Gammaproteobacteria bacterium]